MVARIGVRVHGLNPGRVIDVGHGRNGRSRHVQLLDTEQRMLGRRHLASMLLRYVRHEEHVGAITVELEPVGDVFAKDRRREGSKGLAVLDLEVQHRLHRRRAWVAEDGAGAERARPELHAPLEPADGLAGDERVGRCAQELGVAQHREASADAREALLDVLLRVRRPQEGAVHRIVNAID
jgi:hypothetical protein